jgi:hypothetical protein
MVKFDELDRRYNISRFVQMWLEDYDGTMGMHVLEHIFEVVANKERERGESP